MFSCARETNALRLRVNVSRQGWKADLRGEYHPEHLHVAFPEYLGSHKSSMVAEGSQRGFSEKENESQLSSWPWLEHW